MNMKMKRVASDLRVKAACLLFQEFSFFHNLKLDRDAVPKVAACMKIKPESVLRYLRESGDWFRGILETGSPTPSGVTENINIISPNIRAVATLKTGGAAWKDISKVLHASIPAVKKRWSRWNKLKSQLQLLK